MLGMYHKNLVQKSGIEIIHIVSSDRRQREYWVVPTFLRLQSEKKHHDGLITVY